MYHTSKAALKILFRSNEQNLNEKNLNKKKIWKYWVIHKKNKRNFTISFYKFSNFELLRDWVFIAIVSSYDILVC